MNGSEPQVVPGLLCLALHGLRAPVLAGYLLLDAGFFPAFFGSCGFGLVGGFARLFKLR
jgi:hypothetical protein